MYNIETIIFDLGGVLIDWNPEYLYKKIFSNDQEMRYFLTHISTKKWNEEQDAGKSLNEATEELSKQYPAYKKEIQAYYGRWEEMLGGPISESVALLERIYQTRKYELYALTNWSNETFPVARQQFPFLNYFKGIVVSGEVKIKKPDPRIYHFILNKYNLISQKTIFIDDSESNIEIAKNLAIHTIHFKDPQQLCKKLIEFHIPI